MSRDRGIDPHQRKWKQHGQRCGGYDNLRVRSDDVGWDPRGAEPSGSRAMGPDGARMGTAGEGEARRARGDPHRLPPQKQKPPLRAAAAGGRQRQLRLSQRPENPARRASS
jgi:hypothetical protein